MTAFTDLSFELREQIYKLSLLTSKTIFPYPTYYEEVHGAVPYCKWAADEKIAVGLLGANKQIRLEAATIIFGKNLWHLSGPKELPAGNNEDWPEPLWKAHRDGFRRVEVAFHFGDLPFTISKRVRYLGSLDYVEMAQPESYEEDKREYQKNHLMNAHTEDVEQIQDVWCARMPFIASLYLDYLAVDLKHSVCSMCCCRLDEFIITSRRMFGTFSGSGEAPVYPHQYSAFDKKLRSDHPPLEKSAQFKNTVMDFEPVDGIARFRLHEKGLGCKDCPLLEDGRRDCEKCEDYGEEDDDE
ncbi:MAG: hypothetical protein Q9168_006304 [Polycauliona sp. 1 TL-2023]